MAIIERNKLTYEDVSALISGEIVAIRIPLYYSKEASSIMAGKLLGSKLHGKYENAPDIGRVGQAFFESSASEAAAQRYEAHAIEWIHDMREAFSPLLTPMDRVRLEIDELWPAGATVAMLNGKKMFCGLARTFSVGSKAEPHQDVFSWDAPGMPEAEEVKTQLAMNVYLSPAEKGGELTLWSVSLEKEEYNQNQIKGSYGLQRNALPEPASVISPSAGDLILFNANNVHAVEKIDAGTRVTWSCFIGYRGSSRSLVFWS